MFGLINMLKRDYIYVNTNDTNDNIPVLKVK